MLREIRVLLLVYLVAVIALFVSCFLHRQHIYEIIKKPLTIASETNIFEQYTFIYTTIWESFATDITLSLYTSLFLSLPILFGCVYRFISKSLYPNEKLMAKILFLSSTILSYIAVAVTYFFILPRAINFFITDTGTYVKPMLKISEYVSTFFHLMLGVAIVFHVPLILISLAKLKVLPKKALSKNRRVAIIAIFIVSALLTPPDVISQIICAVVLIVIYEITNFLIKKIC